MVTFKIDAYIAFAELMLSNCVEDGPLLKRCINFNFLVPRYCCGFLSTWNVDKSRGDAELVKSRFGVMHSLYGNWKLAFSRTTILLWVRLVPILTGQMVRIGGLSKVSEYGMIHLQRESLTHLSMSSEQKKNCMCFS